MITIRNLALGLAFGLAAAGAATGAAAHSEGQIEAQGEDRGDTVVTRVEPAPQDAGSARRSLLARDLIGLSAGPNFAKEFERAMSDQMGKMDGKEGEEAAWVRANMPPMMSRVVARVMDDMAPVYAAIYTEDELRAQIDFYRSPIGRAVAGKSLALGVALQDVQASVLESFLIEFESKYCARFECGDAGQAVGKPGR